MDPAHVSNGNIAWDAAGNPTVCGKFVTKMDGKRIELDPNNNTFRMYNENGMNVAQISFLDSYGLGVSMPSIKLDDYDTSNRLLKSATFNSGSISVFEYLNPNKVLSFVLNTNGLSFQENGYETKKYSRN